MSVQTFTPVRKGYSAYNSVTAPNKLTFLQVDGEKMENFICVTCGVQYDASDAPPEHCLICEDERQYIGLKGQRWITLSEMQKIYQNRIEEVDPNITGIGTTPGFAIGQRALLVQTPNGNVL